MIEAKKYCKRPIVVEAVKLTDANLLAVFKWCNGTGFSSTGIYVLTAMGETRCPIGDYMIKGLNDEFYPCPSAVFEASYDAVEG